MAIQRELWQEHIEEQLFSENKFLDLCVRADENVVNGRIVHIPQAGAPVAVQRNRTVVPATPLPRIDIDITYQLGEYTTDPFYIPNIDLLQLSYDKRKSMISQNVANLGDVVAQNVLYEWTRNAVVATNMLNVTGAAGTSLDPTRRKFLPIDAQRAALMFDNQKVPSADRYLLLTSTMYHDFMNDPAVQGNFQVIMSLKTGTLPEYFGFKILSRPSTVRLTAAGVLISPETAATASDVPGAIFWQKNTVEAAIGDIKMFETIGDPRYYGDLYSVLAMHGGRHRRSDGLGLGIIRHIP